MPVQNNRQKTPDLTRNAAAAAAKNRSYTVDGLQLQL